MQVEIKSLFGKIYEPGRPPRVDKIPTETASAAVERRWAGHSAAVVTVYESPAAEIANTERRADRAPS